MFNPEEAAGKIVDWIKGKVEYANAKGVVFGLSGGIDSAVIAYLCKRAFPQNSLGIIMPCFSSRKDEEDAKLVAESCGLNVIKINLDRLYTAFIEAVSGNLEERSMANANIKPRLRMTVLYYHAAKHNYLVVGTGNKSELTVGYFTKHGDSGVDILPIGDLVKTQVYELAKYLRIPAAIIEKPPSAGLWEGQTDEGEMGLSYSQLDKYILTGEGEQGVKEIIEKLNKTSEHKRKMPEIFSFSEDA
jgi:NAD+ synthase